MAPRHTVSTVGVWAIHKAIYLLFLKLLCVSLDFLRSTMHELGIFVSTSMASGKKVKYKKNTLSTRELLTSIKNKTKIR